MAQPYVGELRIFAGNFAPAGWMFCDGQLLAISTNQTLFQLIGTTYGGDGQATFALPGLRGRLPLHFGTGSTGTNYQLAETGGAESVTLTVQQIAAHSHPAGCKAADGNSVNPVGGVPAANTTAVPYGAVPPLAAMNASKIVATGGSQPHANLQPYLGLNFIISLFGIFPSQT